MKIPVNKIFLSVVILGALAWLFYNERSSASVKNVSNLGFIALPNAASYNYISSPSGPYQLNV